MTLNTTYNPTVADGNGVTKSFSYSFNPISINYLKVSLEISGEWVQQMSGWTATVSENGGIVTFDTAPTTRVCIERVIPEEQPTSYETSSGFQAKVIEHSFDMLTGMVQQLQEKSDRSVSVDVGSAFSPEAVVAQIERVYTSIDNVDAVADNETNVNKVAGITAKVTTVANNITNVNKVANNQTNINKVASNETNINTVATDITDVSTVAGSIANVNTVAGDIAKVTAVANNKTNIDKVANNQTNINTVAGAKTNIDKVANNQTNINKVASNETNINTVATNMTDVGNVSTNISKVVTAADNISNINSVNANKTNIDTVATNMPTVTTVAGMNSVITGVYNNSTNINNVAANKTNIDSVAGDLANINAVASDLTNINNASTYASNANVWAEGSDAQVQALGGVHSSKGWAEVSSSGQIQADWEEDDPTSKAYINNKPTNLVTTDTAQTISAVKTFGSSPIVPTPTTSDDSTKAASTAFVKAQGYALDSNVVKTSGNQSIADTKTFIGNAISQNAWQVSRTDFTKGDIPSSTRYFGLFSLEALPQDSSSTAWQDKRLGVVEATVDTSGNTTLMFGVYRNKTNAGGGGNNFQIRIKKLADNTGYAELSSSPASSDNSTKIATTAYVREQIQKVNSLPASPVANVLYCIPES